MYQTSSCTRRLSQVSFSPPANAVCTGAIPVADGETEEHGDAANWPISEPSNPSPHTRGQKPLSLSAHPQDSPNASSVEELRFPGTPGPGRSGPTHSPGSPAAAFGGCPTPEDSRPRQVRVPGGAPASAFRGPPRVPGSAPAASPGTPAQSGPAAPPPGPSSARSSRGQGRWPAVSPSPRAGLGARAGPWAGEA